jgi:hypothetical protein
VSVTSPQFHIGEVIEFANETAHLVTVTDIELGTGSHSAVGESVLFRTNINFLDFLRSVVKDLFDDHRSRVWTVCPASVTHTVKHITLNAPLTDISHCLIRVRSVGLAIGDEVRTLKASESGEPVPENETSLTSNAGEFIILVQLDMLTSHFH